MGIITKMAKRPKRSPNNLECVGLVVSIILIMNLICKLLKKKAFLEKKKNFFLNEIQISFRYNYVGEVDEDLMCQICLQPFVQPIDTPCGHTFCHVCIHNYLKVNPMCPLDRKPLNEMTCSPSNLVLKRYNFYLVLMSVRFII